MIERRNMKKNLLWLTLFIFTPVFAKEYTEYKFVGYQETQPIVDEFTKYEQTTFHQYYTLINGPFEEVEKYDQQIGDYDFCEPSPIKTIDTFSESKPENYTSKHYVILRGAENFETTEIFINPDIPLASITVLEKDKEIANYKNIAEKTSLTIPIPRIPIDDLEIKVEYPKSGYLTISLKEENTKKINLGFSLYNEELVSYIKPYSLATIQEKNLPVEAKMRNLYRYEKEIFNCAYKERKYYASLEDDSLDGYMFDPTEDKIFYKVYSRELLKADSPIEKDEILEELPADSETDKTINSNPPTEEIEKPIENTNSIPTAIKKPAYKPSATVPSSVSQTKIDTSTVTKKEDSDKSYNQIAIVTPEENLNNDKEDNTTCESDAEYDKTLKDIKLALLIVIILSILHNIHLLCVNKQS